MQPLFRSTSSVAATLACADASCAQPTRPAPPTLPMIAAWTRTAAPMAYQTVAGAMRLARPRRAAVLMRAPGTAKYKEPQHGRQVDSTPAFVRAPARHSEVSPMHSREFRLSCSTAIDQLVYCD